MRINDFVTLLTPGLHAVDRTRTCAAYRSAANSVTAFCNGTPPALAVIYTKSFLSAYQRHLVRLDRKRNTISFYMCTLRSLYHIAVSMKKVKYTPNLFSDVFTGSDPTEKRAVDGHVIALLEEADLSDDVRLERCRDFFMLSFYLQGMSFVDLAHLRKSDISKKTIVYRRHKTGSLVTVSIIREAAALLKKYMGQTGDSSYALPIMTTVDGEVCCKYESALHRHNRQLKALAKRLGIEENLTSYVARHSWATIAYHGGVRISLLSQAMGHHTEEVTHVYLSSFETDELEEVNRLVVESMRASMRKTKTASMQVGDKEVGNKKKSLPRVVGKGKKNKRNSRRNNKRKHRRSCRK